MSPLALLVLGIGCGMVAGEFTARLLGRGEPAVLRFVVGAPIALALYGLVRAGLAVLS